MVISYLIVVGFVKISRDESPVSRTQSGKKAETETTLQNQRTSMGDAVRKCLKILERTKSVPRSGIDFDF